MESNGKNEAMGSNELVCANEYPDTVDGRSVSIYGSLLKLETLGKIATPSYVLDEKKLRNNLEILKSVEDRTGCRILLAQKAFSVYQTYDEIAKYCSGTTASGLYEARLGYQYMGKETHVFSPAYKEEELDELLEICDHIVFNSINQWVKYREKCLEYEKTSGKKGMFGLRINPKFSTQDEPIYDPCAFGSRFGVTADKVMEAMEKGLLEGISGLHFHTLCEQNSDDLRETVKVVEQDFGELLNNIKWINLGGGHHITRFDYDVDELVEIICHLKSEYNADIYLEPGEAFVLNAGYMVADVLEIVENDIKTAILDSSAACHMPDIIEMPYTPGCVALTRCDIDGKNAFWKKNHLISIKEICSKPEGKVAKFNNEYNSDYIYRFGGNTCLAGDVFGDYVFENEINAGDKIVFTDMALYSIVKNNTFNGVKLPSIYMLTVDGEPKLIKEFGYDEFVGRL